MIFIQEIPVSKINEYWDIQFQYLVNDGMITTEEERNTSRARSIEMYCKVICCALRTLYTWYILCVTELK